MGIVLMLQRLFFPLQVNQGEAVNVEFARILLRGEPLYHDPSHGPYLYAAYPPFFSFLQALLMKLIQRIWLPGRLLAFVGYLGCATALGWWGQKHWDRLSVWPLVFLFLLFPTWASWGSMVRSDTLMILLEFTAFLVLNHVLQAEKKNGFQTSLLLVAGGLTALALSMKQNAILLPLAYGAYALVEKKWKNAAVYLCSALIPVLVLSALLQVHTGGMYLKYTLLWVPFGFQGDLLLHYLRHSFLPECGWLLIAVFLTWIFRETSTLAKCQVVFSTIWVLGLGRSAAAENYYLEFIIFGIYFCGEGWLKEAPLSGNIRRPMLSKALWGSILFAGLFCLTHGPWPLPPSMGSEQMKFEMLPIYQRPGEHLALDLDLPLMAGKRLWLQPLEYTQMVKNRLWSAEPLLREIREKKYSTIELYDIPVQYLLPSSVVEEIDRNYHSELKKYGRVWLVPNG